MTVSTWTDQNDKNSEKAQSGEYIWVRTEWTHITRIQVHGHHQQRHNSSCSGMHSQAGKQTTSLERYIGNITHRQRIPKKTRKESSNISTSSYTNDTALILILRINHPQSTRTFHSTPPPALSTNKRSSLSKVSFEKDLFGWLYHIHPRTACVKVIVLKTQSLLAVC